MRPVTKIKSEGRLVRIFCVRSPRIDRSRVIALEQTAAHEAVPQAAAHAGLDRGDGLPVHPGGRVEDNAPGRGDSNTPSSTTQWKCRWGLSAEPKKHERYTKLL